MPLQIFANRSASDVGSFDQKPGCFGTDAEQPQEIPRSFGRSVTKSRGFGQRIVEAKRGRGDTRHFLVAGVISSDPGSAMLTPPNTSNPLRNSIRE